MSHADRVPTKAIQEAVKSREAEVLDALLWLGERGHAAARCVRVRASHLGACRRVPRISVVEEHSDGAPSVRTCRTKAQMVQHIEAAEAAESNLLLLSIAASLGAGR